MLFFFFETCGKNSNKNLYLWEQVCGGDVFVIWLRCGTANFFFVKWITSELRFENRAACVVKIMQLLCTLKVMD
jgi:hypothetical protein